MNREKLGEVISAGVASGEAVEAERLLPVFSDTELLAEVERRQLSAGAVAGTLVVKSTVTSVETATPEAPVISAEGLLATFDTAYDSFVSQVASANAERAEVKGRKKDKPAQLETVPAKDIRAEVEAILANEAFLAELQDNVAYFTKNPETDSPDAGFDILITPEELTTADEPAIADALQPKIPNERNYTKARHRPDGYNDTRVPEVTGKGYRIAFAPKHYNVPSDTAPNQTSWMKQKNQSTTATELRTADDSEAMAQISNLRATGALDKPGATRSHQSYFRRFDQTPVVGYVSCVGVSDGGELYRGRSYVRFDYQTRALVVPKT